MNLLVRKKSWYKNWINYSIIIYPTDIVIKENQKGFSSYIKQDHKNLTEHVNHQTQDSMIEDLSPKTSEFLGHKPEPAEEMHSEQQSFNFAQDELVLSPEIIKETMEAMNMSIRQTAEEIGIAHTTLSRYLRKENKRQNNKNDEKMLNWLKEKTLTI